MKYAILAFLLFAVAFGSIASEEVYQGRELALHVNVVNNGDRSAHDLAIRAYVPDLGIFAVSRPFDLESDDSQGRMMFIDLPAYEIGPGLYPVRLSVSNDDFRETRYTWVYFN